MPSAQRVTWAKFRVLTVTAVALLILGTIVYLLTGGTLLEPKASLYLYVPDATGVVAGSPVQVDGIGVGKVESVGLSGTSDPDRIVKLTLTVERNRLTTITADSTAQIASDTLVGDKYIAISSGTSPSHVQPKGEIPLKRQQDLLKTLDMEQFQKQVDALGAVIGDIEQGKTRVGEFVQGDQLYRNLLGRVAEVERGVKAVANTTNVVGRDLYTDRMFQQIHEPLTKLDQSLARIQAGQDAMGKFLRDPAQYQQFRDEMRTLRSSLADLRNGPFLKSAQSYAGWDRQVLSLIQKVDEFNANPVLASSAMYESLNGAAREAQRGIQEFRENPNKFLRLKLF